MTSAEYFKILELSPGSSPDEIKRAYRKKARLYHPDVNPTPEAKDLFIRATEAYEFLIANYGKLSGGDEAFRQAMDDWRKYRQDRSRMRANAYARASYIKFKKTKFYRTTRILDATTIIICLVVSVMMLIYTVFGYFYRLNHPLPDIDNPSVIVFIMLLMLGMLFFSVSLIFLRVHIDSSKKRRNSSGKTD